MAASNDDEYLMNSVADLRVEGHGRVHVGNSYSIDVHNHNEPNHNRCLPGLRLTDPRPCRVLPFPRNEDVVLRRDLFAELDMLLPPTLEYHSAALWGLGGSGKTQIALEYAYRRCDDPTCSVFWVHADNETTFAQDYNTVARKLGLNSKLDGEELLVAVCDRIEAEPRWLLVLDNVDNLGLFGVDKRPNTSPKTASLFDHIPRGPTGTVLWTSRDERIAGTLVGPRRGVRVAQMTIDEAIILLETARNEKVDMKELGDATALLAELHRLPLAISQAGAYMRRTLTPIREYLSRLAEGKERWRVLKEAEFDRYRRAEVSNSILETWSISIERIRQENEIAYKVLHILAYLDNQDISFEVIVEAAKFGTSRPNRGWSTDEQQVDKAIVRLKEFSFLGARRTEAGERSFEMHKLVQEAVQYHLTTKRLLGKKTTKPESRLWDILRMSFGKQREAERSSWEDEDDVYFSNAALQVMIDLFLESKPEMWAQCEKYLRHAIRVCDWAETCGKEVEASGLLSRLSNYLNDRGRWRREKEAVDKRALGLRQRTLGEKHPHTIVTVGNLATIYREQGRYEEAEEILTKVVALQKEALGEKHPDTIVSMDKLAATYHAQGRYEEAEEILAKAVALRKEVLGEKHPDTLQAIHDLALIWRSRGRGDEATALMKECSQLRHEILGPHHPFTKNTDGVIDQWRTE